MISFPKIQRTNEPTLNSRSVGISKARTIASVKAASSEGLYGNCKRFRPRPAPAVSLAKNTANAGRFSGVGRTQTNGKSTEKRATMFQVFLAMFAPREGPETNEFSFSGEQPFRRQKRRGQRQTEYSRDTEDNGRLRVDPQHPGNRLKHLPDR